jgi:hypothetical protein
MVPAERKTGIQPADLRGTGSIPGLRRRGGAALGIAGDLPQHDHRRGERVADRRARLATRAVLGMGVGDDNELVDHGSGHPDQRIRAGDLRPRHPGRRSGDALVGQREPVTQPADLGFPAISCDPSPAPPCPVPVAIHPSDRRCSVWRRRRLY